MRRRLDVGGAGEGALACCQPVVDGLLGQFAKLAVAGEQLGLVRDRFGKTGLQGRHDAPVKLLPYPPQQGLVGRDLHQRMLEFVQVMRRALLGVDQTRVNQALQAASHLGFRRIGDAEEYRVPEAPADHRGALSHLLGRAQPVEPGHQRILQGGRYLRGCRRLCLVGARLEDALGQLFGKKRYAVRRLGDRLGNFRGQRAIGRDAADQRLQLVALQTIEIDLARLALGGPAGRKLGAEIDHQHGRGRHALLDQPIDQLDGGGIGPLQILDDDEVRLCRRARQAQEQPQGFFALQLRAHGRQHVARFGGDSQQRRQQGDGLGELDLARGQETFEAIDPLIGRQRRAQADLAGQGFYDRMERRVGVVGRAFAIGDGCVASPGFIGDQARQA